jgi:hypothetical protein
MGIHDTAPAASRTAVVRVGRAMAARTTRKWSRAYGRPSNNPLTTATAAGHEAEGALWFLSRGARSGATSAVSA